ncbi:MAG: alpha-L-rhamnosidase [Bacteroidales bacterium]
MESKDPLEAQFVSPPEAIQTGVYWYWISDHISKEGVVKDLQAMKQAGINSVFVGNIGQEAPYGPAKIFSDEWWDVVHTMMKTAGELGIEVGMFNCPGWSHAGGPWIQSHQAMRYIVASETRVSGPKQVSVVLPVPSAGSVTRDWERVFIDMEVKPSPHFQDVKVVAFPAPKDYHANLFAAPGAKVTVTPSVSLSATSSISYITQTSAASPIAARYVIPEKKECVISLKLPRPQAARSIAVYPASYVKGQAFLQAKVNGKFVPVDSVRLYCVFPIPSIGYSPYSPFVSAFRQVISDEYRLVVRNEDQTAALGRIILSPTPALDRYPEKTLARMYQHANPPWTEYRWPEQPDIATDEGLTPLRDQVIDLSDKMSADGTLTWDAPAGEWVVLRTGMVPDEVYNSPSKPEDQGWEMDKLTAEHIQYHFDHFIGEMLRRIPPEDRTTFKVVVADSWEKGGTTFTDGFLEKMEERYGYDATPFLPVYSGHVVGSPDMSERYLWDARRLAADLIGNTFMPGLNDVLHPHGLNSWIENYGDWGFPGEFLLYGKYTDKVGGEFWTGSNDARYVQVAASCAHIYNKTQVYAEAFTGGWSFTSYPHTLKPYGDRAIASGMNSPVLHVYIEQPDETTYPGIDAWFGVEFNRKNTWFSQIDQFVTYLKRCGLMLQQGLNKADIAYFIGEDVPVNSGPFGLDANSAKPGLPIPELPAGYQFDYVNSDVIMNDMQVKDGLLTLPHGTTYRILVLPPLETMRPELLQRLEQLAAAGAVILGPAPKRSPSLQGYPVADKQVQDLAAKMWGDLSAKHRNYGQGLILNDMTIQEAFDLIDLTPDCKADYEHFVFNHRIAGDKDIYFIANLKDSAVQITPEFRISGKQPELWNPVTGGNRPLPAYEQKGEVTAVPLQLEGNESMFIVFRRKGAPSAGGGLAANFPQPNVIAEVSSPWTVTFASDKVRRGPTEPVVFSQLQDWSKNADERIRYYSGAATYKTTVSLAQPPTGTERLYLDLGKVTAMAKVKINGQYAGGAWTPPYRVDITSFVKEGANDIEIEVVNTWVNRLIGDQRLPKEQRMVDSRNHPWKANSPLRESGLLGPVRIIQ